MLERDGSTFQARPADSCWDILRISPTTRKTTSVSVEKGVGFASDSFGFVLVHFLKVTALEWERADPDREKKILKECYPPKSAESKARFWKLKRAKETPKDPLEKHEYL